MATKDEVYEVLAMLGATYPRFTPTSDTVKVYYQLLRDFTQEELRAAALHCATTKDFFPSVREIREAVADLRCRAQKVPTAYEAWQDVLKSGKGSVRYGEEGDDGQYYIVEKQYDWLHPVVLHVAEQLGYPTYFPDRTNLMADRAHYYKAYQSAIDGLMVEQTLLPEVRDFVGRIEAGDEIKKLAEGKRIK